jgi:hypothetical protein
MSWRKRNRLRGVSGHQACEQTPSPLKTEPFEARIVNERKPHRLQTKTTMAIASVRMWNPGGSTWFRLRARRVPRRLTRKAIHFANGDSGFKNTAASCV